MVAGTYSQPFVVPRPGAMRRPVPDGRAAVGLTGGLASGKSTALDVFAELGARVMSADAAVHRLYDRPEMAMAVHARFGDAVMSPEGGVDRRALAALVAADERAMLSLEALVHPQVDREVESFIAGGRPGSVTVCEVPLLVEVGAQRLFDLVVTIEAPVEVRRARAAERFATEMFDFLDGRLAGEAARKEEADAAFDNVGAVEELRSFCAVVFESARLLAAEELRDVLRRD